MSFSYLEALLAPVPPADFLARFAQNGFHETRFGPHLASVLAPLPFLKSPDALFGLWPKTVKAQYPKVSDEVSSIEVTTEEAKNLFENGFCLLFEGAEEISETLNSWLVGLRKELGFSELTQSRCLLYATPKGKGTAPHFDQNANFVLQMTGTKTWWLAENESVRNPLSRHTLGQEIDPELATYLECEFPKQIPDNCREITLTAGSLLYVPRGIWHATEAQTDALSLNFTYSAPAWLDLLCAALRSRLALSPEWRETAAPVSPKAAEAASTFERLLEELIQDLPNWNALDILEATEGELLLNERSP